MSQHDFEIANQGFPSFRSDLNSGLQALASNSAGATEPSTTYSYQFWYDETTDLLKMRNGDDDAWITLAFFDQTNDEWEVRSAVIQAVDSAGVTIKTDDGNARISVADDGTVSFNDGNITNVGTIDVDSIRGDSDTNTSIDFDGSDVITFNNGGSESARLDASGNVLVGTTSTDPDVQGVRLVDGGASSIVRNGGLPLYVIRNTSDGNIVEFRKDGSTVGSIGVVGASEVLYTVAGDVGVGVNKVVDAFYPVDGSGSANDNFVDLGIATARWDDVYATNGTIQTSDRNEKQDIEELSEAEQRVAVAAKALLRKFRWKSAVEEKGDDARIHFGIIAQDLQAAFEAEGLDAGRYAMFISSTWWEKEVERTRTIENKDGTTTEETYTAVETFDEPTEGATERTRLGVRYSELLAFIIAAI